MAYKGVKPKEIVGEGRDQKQGHSILDAGTRDILYERRNGGEGQIGLDPKPRPPIVIEPRSTRYQLERQEKETRSETVSSCK